MESLLQSLEMTTPTGWIISALLAVIIFFLRRFITSIDKMEKSVSIISEAVVKHETIVDAHEKRLDKIEQTVFQ